METLRIVLMGKDFELRIISLITRSRELSEEVLLLDTGSKDSTKELAKKVDCEVIEYDDRNLAPFCLLYTSPSPRDRTRSRMPSSA